jgi:spermidine synthase
MQKPAGDDDSSTGISRGLAAIVLLLFVGSGFSALVFEIVWFQLLQLVIGASAVSLALLLATFMGGLCLGSLVLPRLVAPTRHPLRVYAALEFGIGLLGLAVLFLVPAGRSWYLAYFGGGTTGLVLRGSLCALCLLPPTILMGATLPAIARWVETTPRGLARLGFFYGGNTVGGVLGCIIAGFYLLRRYDVSTAAYVAAVVNFCIAAIALVLARRTSSTAFTPTAAAPIDSSTVEASSRSWIVYLVIAASGATALGAEIVWTRLLSLLLGGTTYTFSLILALFLLGIGLGSSAAAWWLGRRAQDAARCTSPQTALAICQLAVVGAMVVTAWLIARSTWFLDSDPSAKAKAWRFVLSDLAWCVATILPAALFWGASFPLATAAAASRSGRDPARYVGGLYAANTLGAIVGAVAFSLFALPQLGSRRSEQILMATALAAAAALWITLPARRSRFAFGGGSLVGVLLIAFVPEIPFSLLAYGRLAPTHIEDMRELYRGEGLNSTVAVSEWKNGVRSFHVSGKVEASSNRLDMRMQRMLGNLPALIHKDPKTALVVGCGAGVTAGSLLAYLGIERIVLCEIEPLVPRHVAPLFADYNLDVVHAPAVQIVYDDARHFVLTTPGQFDVITSDPIHPWVKGAATLYTVEYFESVKRRLRPGGVVAQWVPLYESNAAAVKSELATFFHVFPHGTVWTNARQGGQCDVVLIGTLEPTVIDLAAIEERLARPANQFIPHLLAEVRFEQPLDLFATFAGQASDLAPWLADAELNRDANLRLQYLAGLTPGALPGNRIHRELMSFCRFSDALFHGTDEQMKSLADAIDREHRTGR